MHQKQKYRYSLCVGGVNIVEESNTNKDNKDILRTSDDLKNREQYCSEALKLHLFPSLSVSDSNTQNVKMTSYNGSFTSLQKQLASLDIKNFRVTDNPLTAHLTYPGLSVDSFDPHGEPKLKSLLYNAATARLWTMTNAYNDNGDVFLDWPKVTKGRQAFVASMKMSLSQNFKPIEVDLSSFNITIELGKVGTSSMCIVTKVWSTRTKTLEPLMTLVTQSVSVGPTPPPAPTTKFSARGILGTLRNLVQRTEKEKVKKSIPWPEWFREKFADRGMRPEGLIVPPLPRPWITFAYLVIVRPSDTDFNDHTNFTSYIQFAQDAIQSAIHQKAPGLQGFSLLSWKRGIEGMEVSFQNESHAGDRLTVHVWRGATTHSLCVSVEMSSLVVAQLTVNYFC